MHILDRKSRHNYSSTNALTIIYCYSNTLLIQYYFLGSAITHMAHIFLFSVKETFIDSGKSSDGLSNNIKGKFFKTSLIFET